jgi:hypothetical protein
MRAEHLGQIVEVVAEGHCFIVPHGFNRTDRTARVFAHVNKLAECDLLDVKVGDKVAFTLSPRSPRHPDNIKAAHIRRAS